jgi:hypothetical protein
MERVLKDDVVHEKGERARMVRQLSFLFDFVVGLAWFICLMVLRPQLIMG